MRICGIQKLTLLDYPNKVACTVFTYGCNFRCPFCHNASLVTKKNDDSIPLTEFFTFLDKRKGVLDGVCISGGEPLLQPDIEDFIAEIKAKGYLVKLDTNGSQPEKLIALANKNLLDYVAMDIKNSPKKYSETAGADVDVSKIKQSVEFLKRGVVDYEFRTTLVKGFHSEETVREIAQWLGGAKKYFLQNFVDSGNLIGKTKGLTESEMKNLLSVAQEYLPTAQLRGI